MGRRNLQGGNKTKAMARKTPYEGTTARVPQSEEENYAIVRSVSGNGRFRVETSENKTHIGILPGSMKGHKKRNNYVTLDTIVLINDRRSWQSIKENSPADIVHVYSAMDIERLGLSSYFKETKKIESDIVFSNSINDDIISSDAKDITFDCTNEEEDDEFNIDLI
jgi:hypothetical protein